MAGTFTSLYYHLVFSTKHRQPLLGDTIRPRLFESTEGAQVNSPGLQPGVPQPRKTESSEGA